MCVVLNDDEVSSNEDEPLQKRLWQLFSAGPMVLDETAASTATADKEATYKRAAEEAAMKRAAEEATVKRAMEERAAEEATTKAAAAKEVAGKTANEVAGAAEGSPAPGQAPSVAGAKRAAAPPHQPNVPIGVFGNLSSSSFLSLFSSGASVSYYTFCPGPLPPARPPR
jgi:hypothetical protein